MANEKNNDRLNDFCRELQDARKYRDLELKAISDRSKISVNYLQKLETGDWGVLPAPYIRSFLKTYTQIVGMKTAEVLVEFDSIYESLFKPAKKTVPEALDTSSQNTISMESSWNKKESQKQSSLLGDLIEVLHLTFSRLTNKTIFISLGAISAAVLVVIIYAISTSTKTETVEETPFNEVINAFDDIERSPEPQDTVTVQPEVIEPAPAVIPQEEPEAIPLKLEIKSLTRSYLRLYLDGDTVAVADIMVRPERPMTFEADSLFRVVLGSSGDMELLLNGESLGELGAKKQIATLFIDSTGIKRSVMGKLPEPESEAETDTSQIENPEVENSSGFDL